MKKPKMETKTDLLPLLPLVLFATMAVVPAFSMDGAVEGELVSLGKKTGVGARAISLGEAFTAVADDYSALYYNAAGMTQMKQSELGVNLSYGMSENIASFNGGAGNPRSLESTRLNDVTMVLTDRCRWALGLGYYSPTSFDDPLHYTARGSDYTYDASGQMAHYRMALAYKLADNFSFGLAFGILSGREQLEIQDVNPVRYLEEYTGYNFEPSFLARLSDEFSI